MGNCSIGGKCQFAHGIRELRKPNDPLPNDIPKIEANLVITNFKTVLCKYNQGGFCKNGSNCSYAHGSNDRKEARIATLSENTNILVQDNQLSQMINFVVTQMETLLPNLNQEQRVQLNHSRELSRMGQGQQATQLLVDILKTQQQEGRYIYQSIYKNALLQYQFLLN